MNTKERSSRGIRRGSKRAAPTESAQLLNAASLAHICRRGGKLHRPRGRLLVLGRLPVIGKTVASKNVTRRQRAEQMARGMRGSALEVEINVAAAQPS